MAKKPEERRRQRGRAAAPGLAQKITAAATAVALSLSLAGEADAKKKGKEFSSKSTPEQIDKSIDDDLFTPFEFTLESGLSIRYHKDNLQIVAIDAEGNEETYVLEPPVLMEEMGRFRDMVCKELYNIVFYDNIFILTRGANDILAGETELNWRDEEGGDIRTNAAGTRVPMPWVDKAMGRGDDHHVYFLGKDGTIFHTNVLRPEMEFTIIKNIAPGATRISLIDGLLAVARPGNEAITMVNPKTGKSVKINPGEGSVEGSPAMKETEDGLVIEFDNKALLVKVGEPGKLETVTVSEQPS